jgi:hypothetical protein
MKLTEAALSAILLVAPACATQRSQTRELASTAQAKPAAAANNIAQAKKKQAQGDDQLICEWVDPEIGSHMQQKICHAPNEVQPESDEPKEPAGGFVPSRPSVQTRTGTSGG